MSFVLLLAFTVLFFVAVVFVPLFGKIIHAAMRAPSAERVDSEDVPAALGNALLTFGKRLEADGFRFSHFERHTEATVTAERPFWTATYYHPCACSWASVHASLAPSDEAPADISYLTLYPAHRVATVPPHFPLLSRSGAGLNVWKSREQDPRRRWEEHLASIDVFERDNAPGERCNSLTPSELTARFTRDMSAWFEGALSTGEFVKGKDGAVRVHWKLALSVMFGGIGGKASSAGEPDATPRNGSERVSTKAEHKTSADTVESLPPLAAEHRLALETEAFLRQDQAERSLRMSALFRFAILLVSGIVCSAVLGYMFSFELLLVLVPVLLIHELGHYLAMRVFGYKNCQMGFMPLGAFASGEKDHASVFEQAIVLFAGPLPGILLGFFLLAVWPELDRTVTLFIVMLLVINVANLLPFVPLDGGRLLVLALPVRRVWPRLILQSLSFVALASGAYWISDPFMAVLAVWLMFAMWQDRTIRRLVRTHGYPEDSLDREHQAIFLIKAMSTWPGAFATKYVQIRTILSTLQQPQLRIGTAVAVLVLYGMSLVGPYLILIEDVGGVRTKLATKGIELDSIALFED